MTVYISIIRPIGNTHRREQSDSTAFGIQKDILSCRCLHIVETSKITGGSHPYRQTRIGILGDIRLRHDLLITECSSSPVPRIIEQQKTVF